jgi:hypothetical protein
MEVEGLPMKTVRDIEDAVTKLAPRSLRSFRNWFAEYDAKQWDDQIERDVAAGRLNRVAEEALAEYDAGKCSKL